MKFNVPNAKQLVKEYGLRKKAARAAADESIQPHDTDLDGNQKAIINNIEVFVAESRGDVRENLTNEEKRRKEISEKIQNFSHKNFEGEVSSRVSQYLNMKRPSYQQAVIDKNKARVNYNFFREMHEVDWPARYPKSIILYVGIVLSLFLLETVLNTTVFAKGNPMGMLGGFFEATFVSFINICLGFLVGMIFLPIINDCKIKNKNSHWWMASTVLLVFAIILNNFVTAHYRVLLDEGLDGELLDALNRALTQPFNISSFDAWLLLIAGLMFAGIACYDGYKIDDPIREYGRLDRDLREAIQAKTSKEEEAQSEANQIFETVKNEFEARVIESRKLFDNYNQSIITSKTNISNFQQYLRQMESLGNTLLTNYRDTYRRVSNQKAMPKYFSEKYEMDTDLKLDIEISDIEHSEQQVRKLEAALREIRNQFGEIHNQERQVLQKMQGDINTFFTPEDQVN